MPEIIIINSGQKAELLPADSSFCHGYALFETMRVDSKRLLCWKAHWDRLKLSAQQLGIQCDYDESAVITAIRELVQSDNINDGILKLSLCSEQLFVYARTTLPLPLGPVRLKLDTSSPLNEHSPIAGHKMHN
ncbi:MAG: aminotransferase class IV, partial [Verrucomicrobiota bacterium]|nr:aminotransferase class IV [Verrucomicrobiota bacterium]